MNELFKFLITVGMALPVVCILHIWLPDNLEWYQELSAGMVSAMISGIWLRIINE